LLALLISKNELNVIGLIGIILLIGLVKKNAIMMIDFALDTERKNNKSSADSIYEACLLRFRPIMMTTMARCSADCRWRWDRNRFGTQASAGNHDCWWSDCEPVADLVYHSCGLSLYGPFAAMAEEAETADKPSPLSRPAQS
jgi:hypothetical protein